MGDMHEADTGGGGLFEGGPVALCGFRLDDDWTLQTLPDRLARRLGLDPDSPRPASLKSLLDENGQTALQRVLEKAMFSHDRAADLPNVTLAGPAGQVPVCGRLCLSVAAAKEPPSASVYFIDQASRAPLRPARPQTPEDPAMDQIRQLTLYDWVTGLPNQNFFAARTHELCDLARDEKSWDVALHVIGFNHFGETVNTLGFGVGDEMLRAVAARLRSLGDKVDFVGRLSGNRFGILQRVTADVGEAARMTEAILSVFKVPLATQHNEIHVNVSLGLALYPGHARNGEALIRCANLALDHAKKAGHGAIQIFREEFETAMQRHVALVQGLHRALPNEEFSLYWQPRIDLTTGAVTGAEALLRWRGPDGTLISPAEFIPIAERTGVISRISKWVLSRACAQMAKWQAAGLPQFRIAVNVSALDFLNHNIISYVDEALSLTGLSPELLGLEVTEGVLLDDVDVTRSILTLLAKRGIELSIDDFGTGYCSLSYLRNLPVHHLKIDRSFISNVIEDTGDLAIARSIIELGHNLKLKVIAEGVGSERHAQLLRDEGCDEGQGHYFLMPMSGGEFASWLARTRAGGAWPRQAQPATMGMGRIA
jgi:diguanylate cyclase (GGDEF)-like protein